MLRAIKVLWVTSSDGGAVLLKAADRRLGLLDSLAATVPDALADKEFPAALAVVSFFERLRELANAIEKN